MRSGLIVKRDMFYEVVTRCQFRLFGLWCRKLSLKIPNYKRKLVYPCLGVLGGGERGVVGNRFSGFLGVTAIVREASLLPVPNTPYMVGVNSQYDNLPSI